MREIQAIKAYFENTKHLLGVTLAFMIFFSLSLTNLYRSKHDIRADQLVTLDNCILRIPEVHTGGIGAPSYIEFISKQYPGVSFRIYFPALVATKKTLLFENYQKHKSYMANVLREEIDAVSNGAVINIYTLEDTKEKYLTLDEYLRVKNRETRAAFRTWGFISFIFLVWTITILIHKYNKRRREAHNMSSDEKQL